MNVTRGNMHNELKTKWVNIERKENEKMKTEKILDYLLNEKKQTQKTAQINIEKLNRHTDIMEELCQWIDTRAFSENAINIDGYTAEILVQTTYLTPLGAYNYLIYLREKPEEAIKALQAGLPRK